MSIDSESLVAITVAIWASIATLTTGYEAANNKRDIIITGKINGEEITLCHRKLMLENDWNPLRLGIGLVSFFLAATILSIPFFVDDSEEKVIFTFICFIGSIPLILSSWGWLFSGNSDYKYIKDVLRKVNDKKA